MPINMDGSSVRFVETSFNETTYSKDGSKETKGVQFKTFIASDISGFLL